MPPPWSGHAGGALAVVILAIGWYVDRRATGRSIGGVRAVMSVALTDVVLLLVSGRLV